MLTDEHLCSFAHIVRVDNATNKRERRESMLFPVEEYVFFFSKKMDTQVLRMFQKCIKDARL